MKIVLKPYWIAEECFLQEALMWAGFYRFPLSEIIIDRVDSRFDTNVQDEYDPRILDDHGYIESEEAVRIGLPPNPQWETILDDDEHFNSPEIIKMKMEWDTLGTDKGKLQEALVKAENHAALQAEWDEKYDEYIELVKSKIFIALREGKLAATGRPIPKPLDENKYYTDYEHGPIPASHWRLDEIDWEQSASDNSKAHYCHICVKTDELLSIFPPPPPEQAKAVQIIAGQYILDETEAEKLLPKSKRGRPPKDWDSFYIEVMARVKNESLPDKQESFISDMQAWCLKHWGVEVGRSTILEKISPIYKKFKGL
jgi:hypothetical protein